MDNVNRKNIPLSVLDRYAKMLSSNQVKKLYEAKVGKSYKKMILEEQNVPHKYRLFVSNNAIALSDLDKYTLMNFLQSGVPDEGYDYIPDINFSTNLQGIWVSCKYPSSFMEICKRIAELKISEEVEDTVSPDNYIQYLFPEN